MGGFLAPCLKAALGEGDAEPLLHQVAIPSCCSLSITPPEQVLALGSGGALGSGALQKGLSCHQAGMSLKGPGEVRHQRFVLLINPGVDESLEVNGVIVRFGLQVAGFEWFGFPLPA